MSRRRTTKKSKSVSNEDETLSPTINTNPVFTEKEEQSRKEDGEITDVEDGSDPQPRKSQPYVPLKSLQKCPFEKCLQKCVFFVLFIGSFPLFISLCFLFSLFVLCFCWICAFAVIPPFGFFRSSWRVFWFLVNSNRKIYSPSLILEVILIRLE